MIREDKLKHAVCSFLIFCGFSLISNIQAGLIIAIAIGILKEIYDLVKDNLNNKPLRWRDAIEDLIADGVGISLGFILYYIGGKIW